MKHETLVLGLIVIGIISIIGLVALFLIFKNITPLIAWVKQSVQDPQTGNASSKRLSGLWTMVLVSAIHFVWLKKAFMENSFALLPEILFADLSFVSVALGISAWQRIKKKDGDSPTTQTTETPKE